MSAAAIAWIVLASVIVLTALITFLMNLPELRRYLRIMKM